jgi:hypothetical protein
MAVQTGSRAGTRCSQPAVASGLAKCRYAPTACFSVLLPGQPSAQGYAALETATLQDESASSQVFL